MPVKKALTLLLCLALIAVLTGCSSGSGGHGTEPASESETQGGKGEPATAGPQESSDAHHDSGEAEVTAEPQHTVPPTPAPTSAFPAAPTPTPKGAVKNGWVLSIPDLVPRFEYGHLDFQGSKITEASISTLYSLRFEGIRKADLDAYCTSLREAGFSAAAAKIGSTYTLTASKDLGWNSVAMVITLTVNDGVAIFALDAPV